VIGLDLADRHRRSSSAGSLSQYHGRVAIARGGRATSYRHDCLWFDPHTGRLQAMNYDIHLGRIAGLRGRVAVCLASLVAASLPITGALI
jgi:uncharacterized iron-regulated membrane protein